MKNSQIYALWEKRELIIELVKREIKARYKQSVLGYAWVILVPLINLVVLSIVFSFFVKIPTGGIPYPIFLFIALVPWIFTAQAISSATKSLLANKTLITKIYLPREIFPISSIFAKLIDFLLYTLVLIVLVFSFGVNIAATIFWVPLIFIVHFMLIAGVSFVLSAANVFYRDVENLLEVAIMAWMYLTPVLYPPELVPSEFMPIFNLNPMAPIINAYRNVVLYNTNPPWQSFSYAALVSLVIFIGGYIYFKKRSRFFADVI